MSSGDNGDTGAAHALFLLGMALGGIYRLTGSLHLGMAIHALLDMYSGHLAQAAYAREPAPEPVDLPVVDASPAPGTQPLA